MAKVTGPLFSIEARGKIADAMVHFPWKGLNVVRGWVKPANKKSPDQGDVRLMLGGLGAAMARPETGSLYQEDLLDLAEGTETWNSAFVKFGMKNVFVDIAGFTADHVLYVGHSAKDSWDSVAAVLGFIDYEVTYSGTPLIYEAGFQLYMLARTAIAIHAAHSELFNRAPYLTALASWNSGNVGAMNADMTAA
jgi:hypothetical protein